MGAGEGQLARGAPAGRQVGEVGTGPPHHPLDGDVAAVGQDDANPKFQWAKSSQAYETIGNVAYEFATLTGYKAQFPPPPAPPRFVVEKGDDNLAVVINAPLKAVYQTLINVDKRPDWLDGVNTIDREMTSERINMRHNCVFHGLKLVNTAVYRDYSENRAHYSEKVEFLKST